MKSPQNIDTKKTPETIQNESLFKNQSEVAQNLIFIVSDLKNVFLEMQKKCELIGNYLTDIQIEKSSIREPEVETSGKESSSRMSLIDLLTKGSGLDREPMKPRQPVEEPQVPTKKVKILMKFIDIKHQEERAKDKRNNRSSVRPAYFRLKLIRIYAKVLKYTLRSSNSRGIKPKVAPDFDMSNDNLFYENTFKNREELIEIRDKLKEKNINNIWYRKLFKDNPVKTRNFKIFLEEFFECDIDRLIERFKFKCCNNQRHSGDCRQMWRELRDWSFSTLTGKKVKS